MIRFLALALTVAAVTAPVGTTGRSSLSATCNGAIPWTAARSASGKVATVKGPVVDAYYARSSNGSPTFLNVGRRYPSPSRFTVVIWSENRAQFGAPERRYRGRTICVRGHVSMYQGTPEIEATSPAQIAFAG
jgi:DNA/RNA endonuclease YhcR with UshA esterase domain